MDSFDFCSKELSMKLKSIGFDWLCFKYWPVGSGHIRSQFGYNSEGYEFRNFNNEFVKKMTDAECSAPTLEHAAKWFRKIHDIIVDVHFENVRNQYRSKVFHSKTENGYLSTYVFNKEDNIDDFVSYEEALAAALDLSCEILKDISEKKRGEN